MDESMLGSRVTLRMLHSKAEVTHVSREVTRRANYEYGS